MRVLILGGDGYLGWPTAMYFSKRGCQVTVVDNYFRRDACLKLDATPLYSLPTLPERARLWHELTGHEIKVVIGDLADPGMMRSLFTGPVNFQWCVDDTFTGPPETVIHYAEQPSAPYSLLDHLHANTTLSNNLLVTNNLMFAVRDFARDAHIVKLGTMGEYGTPNIDIEEGWLNIEHNGRKDRFLFPRQGSSIYHTSKIMDTDLLWFGTRTWGLRVTDLMQGPVYGMDTDESEMDARLRPIFNYDEIFGTIINRFLVQAVAGYPLTVYGKGGQVRGYINLRDTLQCVRIAAENPAAPGQLNIYNQIMETFSVNELAEMTRLVGDRLGMEVSVQRLENPRKEAEEHYYNPKYQSLVGLGVKPNLLTEDVMEEMMRTVSRFKRHIRKEIIFKGVKW